MSARSLPDRPSLEQLRKQSKDLLKAYRIGDPVAARAFESEHPRAIVSEEARLADAQLVLARQYGFESWPKLRREVAGRQLRRAIWDHDADSARAAIDAEPGTLHESGPHPRWGGRPTPIQIAAERGDRDLVAYLLDAGADPDAGLDGYGMTALQLAAHWGRDEVCRLLIDRGARVDVIAAALLGDADTLARLLAEDPERARKAETGDTPPLHYAANVPVAECLVDRGAALDTVDDYGRTPVACAVGREQLDVARFLIDRGAPVDSCLLAALGLDDRLSEQIAADAGTVRFVGNIGRLDITGTPLHAAAQHDRLSTARLLIDGGADPNARANAGQTPLHLCVTADVARLLVASGADPSAVDDEHGTDPLTWAEVMIDIHGESPERLALVEYLKSLDDSETTTSAR